MIRTQSAEMSLDHAHTSVKTNRVPYMGLQSLLYQNKINKETVLRYNKSLTISMEELSTIPTSVLIHQSNPQSIPSFSTYHSDDTVYNIGSLSNDNTDPNESIFSVYDIPPVEIVNKCHSIMPNQSIRIRKKPSDLNIQVPNSPNVNRSFLSSCVSSKSSIRTTKMANGSNQHNSPTEKRVSVFEPLKSRPNSYQTINCWEDFILAFSSHNSKNVYWTRNALKQPILNYVHKSYGKSAIKSFKIIQKYMGDRRTRKSPTQLFALLQKSFSHNETLRDEVLIQICRQTINNPDCRSSCRGWELLSECLLQFPPSQKLFPYLDDFILTSLNNEQRKNPSNLNITLANLRKCEYHLSCSMKTQKSGSTDVVDSVIATTCNHKRKRSWSENHQNGIHGSQGIYSPQNLSGLMKQQSFSFPLEEVPLELILICDQISKDIKNADNFLSLYNSTKDSKTVKKISINLEKWFNNACQKGPHLVDIKNIPNMELFALHVLIYWFESLSQPVISQQMAFLSNFSIKNLTKINKHVLMYIVNFLKLHVIDKSKDNIRNIASFLCSLIFQLPKENYYPIDSPKESVYMNIILPVLQNCQ